LLELAYPSLVQDFGQILVQQMGLHTNVAPPSHPLSIPIKVLAAPELCSPNFAAASQSCHFMLASPWLLQQGQTTQDFVNLPAINFWTSLDGWLYQPLADVVLADWLTQLQQWAPAWQSPPPPLVGQSFASQDEISLRFYLGYSHARCCHLLRLAHEDGLLTLIAPYPHQAPTIWQVNNAEFHWLNAHQQLLFSAPAELQLLQLLLDFPLALNANTWIFSGDIYNRDIMTKWPPNSRKLLIYLQAWVDGFDGFYRTCRIWGDVLRNDPQVAQARLGLLIVVQALLRFLLVELLGEEAPLEL
jgi:hypothetical protein